MAIIRDPKTGKALVPRKYYIDEYVRVIHSTLSRIFNVAIQQGWIKDNPCKNAVRPKKINQIRNLLYRLNKSKT